MVEIDKQLIDDKFATKYLSLRNGQPTVSMRAAIETAQINAAFHQNTPTFQGQDLLEEVRRSLLPLPEHFRNG